MKHEELLINSLTVRAKERFFYFHTGLTMVAVLGVFLSNLRQPYTSEQPGRLIAILVIAAITFAYRVGLKQSASFVVCAFTFMYSLGKLFVHGNPIIGVAFIVGTVSTYKRS
ncbi:MAG: hypothetical protein P4M11_14680 [Candidatus Pacebacteria bacterium]|nr:hypothetical protein [Candidatus Paceibacterota bacterium]